MTKEQVREWFEKDLKNYDDPFWCYHSDLRNMFDNIFKRMSEHVEK